MIVLCTTDPPETQEFIKRTFFNMAPRQTAKTPLAHGYDCEDNEGFKTKEAPSGPQVGGIEILKVVREYVPLRGGGTATFGETIDNYLTDCAKECVEIQEVKLMFSPEQWHAAAENYRKAEISNY